MACLSHGTGQSVAQQDFQCSWMHLQSFVTCVSLLSTSAKQRWSSWKENGVVCRTSCLVVERVDSYKYLGFVFQAVQNMAFGAAFWWQLLERHYLSCNGGGLGIRDPALQCKLFDTLVLLILSYGCEVWAVNSKLDEAAELSHRDFLKRLLGVRKSAMSQIVLCRAWPISFAVSLLAANLTVPSQSTSTGGVTSCQTCIS